MSWAGIFFSGGFERTVHAQRHRSGPQVVLVCPFYFLAAWLCGELALIHLIWQVAPRRCWHLPAVFGTAGTGRAGPFRPVLALAWVYLHCQAMDSSYYLIAAPAPRSGAGLSRPDSTERQRAGG